MLGWKYRWCCLTKEERAFVIEAIRCGMQGDVLMPSDRWYRIRGGR